MARQTITAERPFVIPRRQWPWQRVRYLPLLLLLFFVLFFGRNFGYIYGFFPVRWQLVFTAILLFFAGLFFARSKPLYLICLMIFLATWRQGTFYHPIIENDLLLLSDFPMCVLLLLMPIYHSKRIKFRVPIYIGVILTFWYLTGRLVAVDPPKVMNIFMEQMRAFLFFFLIAKFIQTEKDLRVILGALMVLLMSQGILAMYSWKFGGTYLFGGFFTGGSGVRTSGAFGHPNALGVFLTLMLPLAYRYCALVATPKMAWFFGLAFLSGLFALYSTFSRSAWFAAGGVVALMLVWDLIHRRHWFPRYKVVMALAVLGVMAICIKYPGLVMKRLSGVSNEFDSSKQYSRLWYMMEAFPIIKANPIFGVGARNYQRHTVEGTRVHSTYLYMAATIGLPGLMLFLAFMAVVCYALFLAWWYGPFYIQEVVIGLGFGLLGFLIASIAAPDYCFYGSVRQNVWIVAGVAVGMLNLVAIPLPERRRRVAMPRWNVRDRYAGGIPQTIPLDMRKRYPETAGVADQDRPGSAPPSP